MPEQTGEKTEKATPKRREEARKKGNVAKSNEVNSSLVLLTGTLVFIFFSHHFFANIQGLMHEIFENLNGYDLSQESLRFYNAQTILFVIKVLTPLVLSVLIIGTTANVMQVGFMITGEPLKPDMNKINPLNGFKRIFSAKSAEELIKGLLKITTVGVVVYITIIGAAKDFIPLMDQSIAQVASFLGHTIMKMALRTSIALVFLAAFDFVFQRWDHEKSLKMTKDEVKQEMKQYEGDPLIKSRIRSVQREMSHKRMMSEVPNADVIITNPIHYAVALKYVSGEMNAPVVVAKGARKVAEKIKQIAREHDVPIVENPPLARALFKMCDVGQETPVDLYKSVAEVLAYIYRLKQKGAQ